MITGGAFLAMASLLAVHGAATPGLPGGREQDDRLRRRADAARPARCCCWWGRTTRRARPGPVGPLVALLAARPPSPCCWSAGSGWRTRTRCPGVRPRGRATWRCSPSRDRHRCLVVVAMRAATTVLLTRRPRDLCVLLGLGSYLRPGGPVRLRLGRGGFLDGPRRRRCSGSASWAAPGGARRVDRRPSRPLGGDLRAVDLLGREEAFLGRGRCMRCCVAWRRRTDGHTRRVAMLAVAGGRGARPPRDPPAPRLALGGILHDIGKLRVPDAILKKPAAAHRRGVRRRPPPPRLGRRAAGGAGLRARGPRDRARPPRAARRHRLPVAEDRAAARATRR